MRSESDKNELPTENEMSKRYEVAQSLVQGVGTKNIAFNTTLIPHWIGNSDCFWYERESRCGKEFRIVDASICSNEALFDHECFADILASASGIEVNSEDIPITKIHILLSPLVIKFDAFGRRWVYIDDKKSCVEEVQYPNNWSISPDGSNAAFVRDHNIWIREIASGNERALTQDGEPFYCYASTPSASGFKWAAPGLQASWSPDGKRLFTLQMDTRKVKTMPMIAHVPSDGRLRPFVIDPDRRVALPGDDNIDEYRFLCIDIDSGKQQDAHYRRCPVFRNALPFFTYPHSWWARDSRYTYFLDLERGGDHVARLVEFDTCNGRTRVVIEEESPDTCFKLRLDSMIPYQVRLLPDSDDVIWYSERSGWAHLYLYDLKTGELKHPITKGDWLVRDIHHYDPERRELVIQTAGRDHERNPYYRDVCCVNIDTGELRSIVSTDDEYVIFEEGGELAANISTVRDIWGGSGISKSGRYIVTTRSRADTIPVSLLLDRSGNELLTLETAECPGLPLGWQWPEPVKLLAADGETDIYGHVFRPSHFSSTRSYPVLDFSTTLKESNHYLAGSFTNEAVAGAGYLYPAALAELGFIVVDIYGRGTSSRYRAFSADPNSDLPCSNNQADRIAGIRQLAEKYTYMDLDRVGVGGSLSTNAPVCGLLGNPEFYKVGVSHGSGIDMRLKSAYFGEAYGDLPTFSEKRRPVSDYAKNLKGNLLIMHGMLSPSINVANSFGLIDALQRENKDFDMLILPNDKYPMSSYAIRRGWDYLVKHLLGVKPPMEFKLTTSWDLFMEKFYMDQ